MKILLIGEYSGLHNTLKKGLQDLGHHVVLVSTGDAFKKYPADILLNKKYNSGLLKKIKVAIYKLTKKDITSIAVKNQFFKHQDTFKNFDVVQLINESPLGIHPTEEKNIISFLKKHNKKLFLLSCGTDVTNVQYALNKKLRYSVFYDYFNGKAPKKQFDFALKYTTPPFIKLHNYVHSVLDGIISSDLDYHIPLQGNQKYKGLIPNPINLSELPFIENPVKDKINIFLGINRSNYYTKGIRFFEEAIHRIQKKYAAKITVKIVENLPYATYIKSYNKAHIILDQVLSYDQGYNALEAMAKGKVVFTGAEKEFYEYYGLENPVAINALPDAQHIADELEKLIINPEKITQIAKNARAFIEKQHNNIAIAKKYIATWNQN